MDLTGGGMVIWLYFSLCVCYDGIWRNLVDGLLDSRGSVVDK